MLKFKTARKVKKAFMRELTIMIEEEDARRMVAIPQIPSKTESAKIFAIQKGEFLLVAHIEFDNILQNEKVVAVYKKKL